MQKNVYSYLQRSLLKVIIKFPHCSRSVILVRYKINSVKSKKPISVKLNGFIKYTKKYVNVNFVYSDLIGNLFFLSFIKHSPITFIFAIKFQIFINKQDILSKAKLMVSYNSSFLFTCFQIQNLILNSFVINGEKQIIYFSNQQTSNFLKNTAPFFIYKINYFSAFKNFYNLYFFIRKNGILNKKKELGCSLSKIAFPFFRKVTVYSISNKYSFEFLEKTLTIIHIYCLLTLKYVEQKELSQRTLYKVFIDLVTIFDVYQFNKKSSIKVKINTFPKKVVLITKIVNPQYCLIRPLFSLTRLDTFFICKVLRLPIYPDQSNLQMDFLRNRIRKQILPAIRILLNPKFDTILCKFNQFYA